MQRCCPSWHAWSTSSGTALNLLATGRHRLAKGIPVLSAHYAAVDAERGDDVKD
jgi:hypothetical protein